MRRKRNSAWKRPEATRYWLAHFLSAYRPWIRRCRHEGRATNAMLCEHWLNWCYPWGRSLPPNIYRAGVNYLIDHHADLFDPVYLDR